MYIPKRYGESKIDKCMFCSQQATLKNQEGVPTCMAHKNSKLNDMKCICGNTLEQRTGKFGLYYNCMRCGNISLKKVLEIYEVKDLSSAPVKKEKKEVFIRSDDPLYFD